VEREFAFVTISRCGSSALALTSAGSAANAYEAT
jgi:hypothetical protein